MEMCGKTVKASMNIQQICDKQKRKLFLVDVLVMGINNCLLFFPILLANCMNVISVSFVFPLSCKQRKIVTNYIFYCFSLVNLTTGMGHSINI